MPRLGCANVHWANRNVENSENVATKPGDELRPWLEDLGILLGFGNVPTLLARGPKSRTRQCVLSGVAIEPAVVQLVAVSSSISIVANSRAMVRGESSADRGVSVPTRVGEIPMPKEADPLAIVNESVEISEDDRWCSRAAVSVSVGRALETDGKGRSPNRVGVDGICLPKLLRYHNSSRAPGRGIFIDSLKAVVNYA